MSKRGGVWLCETNGDPQVQSTTTSIKETTSIEREDRVYSAKFIHNTNSPFLTQKTTEAFTLSYTNSRFQYRTN